MRKFLIGLLITFCFSVEANASKMLISCENDYIGKTVSSGGKWIDDKIAIGNGEWFYIDTKTLPQAVMEWDQDDNNKGKEIMTAIWNDNSITFINNNGIILYQYYPQHNKMFKSKINNIYGIYPYGGIFYTTCTHSVK